MKITGDRFIDVVVVACAVLVIFCVQMGISEHRETNRWGECVMIKPFEMTKGRISNFPGFLSSGPVRYHLWFKGKTAKTGEDCQVLCRVTEAKFNEYVE